MSPEAAAAVVVRVSIVIKYPTSPFTILDPQDQEIDEFYVVEESRTADFEVSKL